MGFFADAGPLQIFVSQHLIPSHYRVEITDDAAFESEENAPPIKAGAFVRVRLVGLKAEANQLVSNNICVVLFTYLFLLLHLLSLRTYHRFMYSVNLQLPVCKHCS